jgi:arsenate reductase
MKIYGIPNCTTVKKARDWLARNGMEAEFHDFKKAGVSEPLLKRWAVQVGWEKLLKRQGPTWSQLPAEVKAAIVDEPAAIAVMLEKPNLIKRPVLEQDGKVLHLGFNETAYQTLLGKK